MKKKPVNTVESTLVSAMIMRFPSIVVLLEYSKLVYRRATIGCSLRPSLPTICRVYRVARWQIVNERSYECKKEKVFFFVVYLVMHYFYRNIFTFPCSGHERDPNNSIWQTS